MSASLFESLGFLIIAAFVILLVWIPLNWRSRLQLVRRFTIKADKAAVWQAVRYAPGDVEWHPHLKKVSVLDSDKDHMRLHYGFQSPDGRDPEWSHDVAVETIEDGAAFNARRLDVGDDDTDKLLELSVRLTARDDATVLEWRENWGRRSLAGRFMAYSDADTALSQLKSYCETGKVCQRTSRSAGAALSLFSALITVAAFSLLIGWELALLLAIILVVHEFGHLVSFRMVGQPWGRVMFVPFVGGVAVSRMYHRRLADDVFCALMGAGLSVVLLLPGFYFYFAGGGSEFGGYYKELAVTCAAMAGVINLLNLLPIFPLDGGRVMRATFQSISPGRVQHWMYAIAGLIGGTALFTQNSILAAMAAIAFFQSSRLGPPKDGMQTMGPASIAVLGVFYAGLVAAHGTAFWLFKDTLFG